MTILDVFVLLFIATTFLLILSNRKQADKAPRAHDGTDRYNPMQDTSPHMYNRHNVHKHNPMLDK